MNDRGIAGSRLRALPRTGTFSAFAFGAVGLLVAAPLARGETPDRCSAKGVMGGKEFVLTHCALSVYDNKGATLWFSESAFSPEEIKTFQMNSYPKDRDATGKPLTMISLAFCPGGGKAAASPAAVPSVEVAVNHASSPMLSRQWVFEIGKDTDLRIEKLAGTLAPGERLTGRMTGKRTSDGVPYSWEIDFDLPVPAAPAAAGPGCGP